MNRGAFRGWAAVAASVAVCLLAAVAAPAARAGSLWVTEGGGSCNAFSVYGDSASFIVPSSCPMTIQVGNAIPLGENALLDDDRATRDHDQPGVDRERGRQRWRLDHRRGRSATSGRTSRPARGADRPSRRASTGSTPGSRAARTSTARSTASRSSAHRTPVFSGVCASTQLRRGSRSPGSHSRAQKTRRPSVTGQGALWASGSYVWNPPGDDFPVALYSSDVSGICSSGRHSRARGAERPVGAA